MDEQYKNIIIMFWHAVSCEKCTAEFISQTTLNCLFIFRKPDLYIKTFSLYTVFL